MHKASLWTRLEGLLSILGVLLIWQALSILSWIDLRFFPAPSAILENFISLLSSRDFIQDCYWSMQRLLAASAIAIPSAIAIALLIEGSSAFGRIFRPWIAILYPIPKLAVFPLLLIIFGVGESSKVAMIFIGTFFLVLISSMQGLKRILNSPYHDIVRVYRVPTKTYIFRILLQGSLPEILTGCKMGLGYGLVMVVASEFTASHKGLGVFIWNSWDQFRILDLYSGVLMISLIGILIFSALDFLAAKIARYY